MAKRGFSLIAYGLDGDFLSSLVFQAVNQIKGKLLKVLTVSKVKVIDEQEGYQKWGFIELPITVLYHDDQPILTMSGFQSSQAMINKMQEYLIGNAK